jgi:hypothetical protein
LLRQARAQFGNKVEAVIGISEEITEATVLHDVQCASNGGLFQTSIGVDSITAFTGLSTTAQTGGVSGNFLSMQGKYSGNLSAGYHFLAWLEQGSAGTANMQGTNSGQTGLQSVFIM